MADFGNILKNGKRRAAIKSTKGKWLKCDSCSSRRLTFPYKDNQDYVWQICETCIEGFVTAGGKSP